MIKYSRALVTILLAVIAFGARAQSTTTPATSSPYSRYGLGEYVPALLPQNIAMGGIGTAINSVSGYNNINVINPASYGMINYTTIDAGIYANIDNLNQNNGTGTTSVTNANFRLSHIAFAVPVNRHSALSFGLLPYSELGYNYKITQNNFGTSPTPSNPNTPKVDTNAVNYLYNGEGGLSKAYIGYGYHIGKHLLIGGNVSYIFGNLAESTETEIPTLYGTLDSKVQQTNSVGGFNYDYGIQYSFDFADVNGNTNKHLVFGYSTSTGSSLNSTSSYVVSQYTYDSSGNQNLAADSLVNNTGTKSKIKLPRINRFGVSFQNDGHFLIGADYTVGNWSSLTIDGTNAGLQNSKTLNVGGSITPNINALRNYWARVDYRFGFIYEDTYLNVNNTDIKKQAVTFGFGLPLPNSLSTFDKINLSAEVGREGTLNNGLVKENYVNIHIGFTLNDKWFQRFKFQ
jgi:hypothetical protein